MKNHLVRSYSSKETLERVDELAWKLAALAADKVPVEKEVADMVINRVIDNAAVAIAAINRLPPSTARSQAIAHPNEGGATLFSLPNNKFSRNNFIHICYFDKK